ncbi:hypothetical protein OsJ_20405 [Oryza sativa Japonica Group]|uniref:Uncharacterized protein n=1 Tax=Oryza sativa subsp. japonica TaxID=39947 RepID=A3B956_ORYSJ|nr:hypothetical protein OsJ_20405 [Oryza sativa Japonica Group]
MEEMPRLAMGAAMLIMLLTVWSSPEMAMAASAAATVAHRLGLNGNETGRINVGVRRNLKIAVPLKHGFSAFVNVSDQGVRRWP